MLSRLVSFCVCSLHSVQPAVPSWVLLLLLLASTPGAAADCGAAWPDGTVVASLEELVSRQVVAPDFDLIDFQDRGVILVFDFRSRAEQNVMFDRISTFSESADYRGRIVPGQGMTDYDGHNLSSAVIARYFRTAEETSAELSAAELRLRAGLLCLDLLVRIDGDLVGKPRTAVLAINHDTKLSSARAAIVSHELYHGLDMTREDHWRWTKERWSALEPSERAVWQELILGQRRYDREKDGLVLAEFGAYSAMFDLDRILALRASRDLSGLSPRQVLMLERGRSFGGLLLALSFKDPSFLFEMEYGYKEGAKETGLLSFDSKDQSHSFVVFSSWQRQRNAIGRSELLRQRGRRYSVLEVDSGRLDELLTPTGRAKLMLVPVQPRASALLRRLRSFAKRLPEEEALVRLLEARGPGQSGSRLGLLFDCESCGKAVRLSWLLYQIEMSLGSGEPGSQISTPPRVLPVGALVDLHDREKASRAALLAVSRSGMSRSVALTGLPPEVAALFRWAMARLEVLP